MMCFVVELRHVVPRFGVHGGPARTFACDGFHGGVPPDPRHRLLASGLRNVALDRGLARRLAKPASTCALDCPPICRGKGATKPFRKPQSVLMSFPSARQLRGDKGLLHFGRIDSVRHQPLCGGTCIASDWRRPAGTRGRAGELFESSSRGAQQRGDAGVARRPAFPGLYVLAGCSLAALRLR